jgi:hypothetical protein
MPSATPEDAAQAHPCVRCGRPVPLHVALCEECNPLGLSDPASSQAHGIAIAGIIAFVIFLAVVARVTLAGLGPFTAAVVDAVPTDKGLRVTIEISNAGSRSGQTNCVLTDPRGPVTGDVVRVQTPVVPAGETIRFESEISRFGSEPVALGVQCTSP